MNNKKVNRLRKVVTLYFHPNSGTIQRQRQTLFYFNRLTKTYLADCKKNQKKKPNEFDYMKQIILFNLPSARRSIPGGQVVSNLCASFGASRSNQYPSLTDRTTLPF